MSQHLSLTSYNITHSWLFKINGSTNWEVDKECCTHNIQLVWMLEPTSNLGWVFSCWFKFLLKGDLFPSIVTILTYKSIIIWPEQPSWENKKKTLCTRAKWDGENWAWKSTMPKPSCKLKIEGKKKERAVITWWMLIVKLGRTGKYWTLDMTSN